VDRPLRPEGPAGLADRSSRPHRSPRQVPLEVELQILQARLDLHAGPVQLAVELGRPASTIGQVLPDEKVATCAAFLHRAVQWFHQQHGVTVRRVLTDDAMSYRRGNAWAAGCSALQVKRRFIKPFCPWTNGKAERFNRTLLTDWAYARPWTSNARGVPSPRALIARAHRRHLHARSP